MKISHTAIPKDHSSLLRQNNTSSIKMGSFSQQFQSFKDGKNGQHLTELLKKIKKKSQQVVQSRSIRAVNEYKSYIKEYLEFILNTCYRVKELYTMWDGESLSIVTVMDKELDELGRLVLDQEKDTISLVDKINEIQGLLISVYK